MNSVAAPSTGANFTRVDIDVETFRMATAGLSMAECPRLSGMVRRFRGMGKGRKTRRALERGGTGLAQRLNETLARWPGEDHRSRLVFITKDLPEESIRKHFRPFVGEAEGANVRPLSPHAGREPA